MKGETIEIPLSKGKIALLLSGSIAFVFASLWMYNGAAGQTEYAPVFLKTVGGIGFAFFGICGLFMLKKLSDSEPGLVISPKGINDNTSSLSIKMIEWKDILGFETLKIAGQKLIVVKLRNSQKYIDKAGNNAQKRLLKLNDKQYGSPVHLSTNSLKIGFEELFELLEREHLKYGGKKKKK